jgi:hypothetical protein
VRLPVLLRSGQSQGGPLYGPVRDRSARSARHGPHMSLRCVRATAPWPLSDGGQCSAPAGLQKRRARAIGRCPSRRKQASARNSAPLPVLPLAVGAGMSRQCRPALAAIRGWTPFTAGVASLPAISLALRSSRRQWWEQHWSSLAVAAPRSGTCSAAYPMRPLAR